LNLFVNQPILSAMKHFIKIKDSRWYPGSQKKMIYTAENGNEYIGPRLNMITGHTYCIEASDGEISGSYEIIAFIGEVGGAKKN